MTFTIPIMLIKLSIGLILLPIAGFAMYKGMQAFDKKDNDWSKSDIKGNPLPTAIYAGLAFLGLCILAGLTLCGLLIGLFL